LETALNAREEIHDLISAYCRGVDRRDEHLFRSLCHDDAVYEVGGQFDKYVGVDQVVDRIRQTWATFPETHHWATNILVEVPTHDVATAQSNVLVHNVDTAGKFVVCAADYDDRLINSTGRWRFQRRSITIHYVREIASTQYP
jgi:hypothetical protein